MTTQVAFFCGPGRTLVGGVCMSRVAKRQIRRCAVWGCRARLPSVVLSLRLEAYR
jgi:hypothetical protein